MAQLKNTTISDIGSLNLPAGTTAQRPASPSAGMIRYNTTINDPEYYDGSGWKPISESNPEATGGTIIDTTIGGVPYRIHYFTSTGNSNFTVTKAGEVEYLIVAGGGGGGVGNSGSSLGGGGGGGGGLLTGTTTVTPQTYTITVGAGGAAGVLDTSRGSNGGNSSALGLTAIGGGGGGTRSTAPNGANGGSGGGPAYQGTVGQGTAGQGNNGSTYTTSGWFTGGGGGAGSPGVASTLSGNINEEGGQGLLVNITGSPKLYAAGGGGGGHNDGGTRQGRAGGAGGGGRGGSHPSGPYATSGAVNSGSGGGGGNAYIGSSVPSSIGGDGGSGIVIVRYRRNNSTSSTTSDMLHTQPYNYNADVRPIVVNNGLVLDLDSANPDSYSGTGTTWFDLSGNGLNSSLVNGVEFTQENYGSLIFDGSVDYVSVPAPSSPIEFGTNLTHEVWIYPTDYANSGGNRQYLIDPRGDAATSGMNAYFLFDYISAPDTVRITVGNSGVEVRTGNFSMPLNRWHHIVATRNNAVWNVYLNGVNIYNATSSSLTPLTLNNSFRVATYANGSSGQYFFEGKMGIARLYNIPLTQAQVKQNFNAFRGRYGV